MAKNKPDDKSPAKKVVKDAQLGARRGVLEELFNDLYDDRRNVYLMNFLRGIFFGVGSVLGATIVVAFLFWILSIFVDFPGLIGDIAKTSQDALESR